MQLCWCGRRCSNNVCCDGVNHGDAVIGEAFEGEFEDAHEDLLDERVVLSVFVERMRVREELVVKLLGDVLLSPTCVVARAVVV